MRSDNRASNALRPVTLQRNYLKYAEGSVLISFGDTKVICAATVDPRVPPFLRDSGTGWVTAEYSMLPRSAQQRILRDSVKKGRAMEIRRLIGRSLRCVVDLDALGERQIIIDCDVIQADGDTRCAAITGGYVALHDALASLVADGRLDASPLAGQCAAVSVGIVRGEKLVDLCYDEDYAADVDMNLVMRDDGGIIEVQGTAEGEAFSRDALMELLDLGESGIRELFAIQNEVLDRG